MNNLPAKEGIRSSRMLGFARMGTSQTNAVIRRYSALVDGALLKGYALIAQKWLNTALTCCKKLQVIALVLACGCGMWASGCANRNCSTHVVSRNVLWEVGRDGCLNAYADAFEKSGIRLYPKTARLSKMWAQAS